MKKKQLERKDKEIKDLQLDNQKLFDKCAICEKQLNKEYYAIPKYNKRVCSECYNQKAIEELRKVLENFFIGKCKVFYNVQKDMYVLSERDKVIIDFIENRLAELQGDKNGF